jgi:hypothetical protein
MTTEEIKKLSDEEINKIIHKWMGRELKMGYVTKGNPYPYPAYCSDNSPRKLLNDVLEKMSDEQKYRLSVEELGVTSTCDIPWFVLEFDARQICEAIVEVVKG